MGTNFFYAGLAISFVNALFGAIDTYPSPAFWAVETIGVTILIAGGYLIHREVKQEDAEDKAKAEAKKVKLKTEGIIAGGIIEDLRQYAASSFSTSIGAVVKVTPEYSGEFTTEVYIGGVKNIYMPQFQPGAKVEIRYVPSDHSINEFIKVVGQTKDYREEAEQ